jgi:hypothetical protein
MRLSEAEEIYNLLGDAIAEAKASGRDTVSIPEQAAKLDDKARIDLESAIQETGKP